MVYEFVRDQKGRHLALSCHQMMEVVVRYTGFRFTKCEKSRLGGKFGQIWVDKTGFLRLFAVTLEYCGNCLGITLGPERPTFFLILGVSMADIGAIFNSYLQKRPEFTVCGGKFSQICLHKLYFSSFSQVFWTIVRIVWASLQDLYMPDKTSNFQKIKVD